MKDKIEFSEFLEIEKKLEIKVGKIVLVEEIEKSKKLLKLTVNFGEDTNSIVVTNIKPHFTNINILQNMSFLFITNLKPVIMMGIESTAMILPGEVESGKLANVNAQNGTTIL